MRRPMTEKITGRDVVESLVKQAVSFGSNVFKIKGVDVKIELDRRTFLTTLSAPAAMDVMDKEVWTVREPWSTMHKLRAAQMGTSPREIRPIMNGVIAARWDGRPHMVAVPFIVADAAEPDSLYIAKPGTLDTQTQLRQFKYCLMLNELPESQDQFWKDSFFSNLFYEAHRQIVSMLELENPRIKEPGLYTQWNDREALVDFTDGTKIKCSDVVENGWLMIDPFITKLKELAA